MSEAEELRAEIARLKLQVEKLKPTLRTRVNLSTLLGDSDKYLDQTVGVGGWIRTVRTGGGGSFCFIKAYDGTTGEELQVIASSTVPGFDQIKQNSVGTAIFVTGKVVASQGKEQKIELDAIDIRILGVCNAAEYPLGGKKHPLEYLRSIQHFRPRTAVLGAVTRVRNALAFATHQYFQEGGFQYCHTPLITASDCEGGGEMFQVTTLLGDGKLTHTLPNGTADYSQDFFKRPAFLTVSGQLNAEIYATALSNVYTFGPTFRAENSHTSRHLAEFWMIEPEIAFADLQENMDVAEGFIKFTIQAAMERCPRDFEILEEFEIRMAGERKKQATLDAKQAKADQAAKFKAMTAEEKAEHKKKMAAKKEADKQAKQADKGGKKGEEKKEPEKIVEWRDVPLRQRLATIVNSSFARVTYTKAIELLKTAIEGGHKFEEMNIEWGMDMGSEHERYLCERLFKRPTIVTNYPKEIKAFYMRLDEGGKTVSAMDVLVPGVGELIGGSQREERYGELTKRLEEMKLPPADYAWYMDLRKFGSVPHSGFGCGFERLVCYTTGMDNIRDVIPFPRYPGHAEY